MEDHLGAIMVAAFILIALIVILLSRRVHIQGHWQHFYDNITFSPDEFYSNVKEQLAEREITGLSFHSKAFQETHALSARRKYLEIDEHEYEFYICAAPFGRGMFVSWWLCSEGDRAIVIALRKLMALSGNEKTFYELDTESMYKSAIHNSVVAAADNLTGVDGYRLTEHQKEFVLFKTMAV